MNKFFALVAVMALCSVSMFATDPSDAATISVNVARPASISWISNGAGKLTSQSGLTTYIVSGQTAEVALGNVEFHVTGEAGATVGITYGITLTGGTGLSLSSAACKYSNVSANDAQTAGSTSALNALNAFSQILVGALSGTPGTSPSVVGDGWANGYASITSAPGSTGSALVTFNAAVTNYTF